MLRKLVDTATLANLVLIGVLAVLRYIQVVIWGRVREIREEVVERAITRSAWLVSVVIVYGFSYPGKIHHTVEATFSQNNTMVMPVWTCQANKVMNIL